MNKEFAQFLNNKQKIKDDYHTCKHDENHWCQNCVNFGQYHDFRSEGLGHGYIHTNLVDPISSNER